MRPNVYFNYLYANLIDKSVLLAIRYPYKQVSCFSLILDLCQIYEIGLLSKKKI